MKLGIGSYAYYWGTGVPGYPPATPLTAHDLIDKAADLGVRLVQIDDNLPLHTLPSREVTALASHARDKAIELEIGTRGIQPDLLREYLRLASSVGSPLVRTVLDTGSHHVDPDEVVSALKAIIPEYERAGVSLTVENHDRVAARTLAQIIERVGSDCVGVCLDTVNSFGALEGPEVVVEALAPLCKNLHVKDFRIRRVDHVMGFVLEGTPAGQGMLDIPWLLASVSQYQHDPSVILELWTPPESDLEATIAREDRWARESIAYLRQHISD
ncbi:MAG: sugar phosphate isomerase/epimerase [Chloroflexi bacterium]|nr:sugar phosphate isomerase/epimerase [Chloroflexota bacterium]